jgi:DNA-binding NarL/FixJ family response regulator
MESLLRLPLSELLKRVMARDGGRDMLAKSLAGLGHEAFATLMDGLEEPPSGTFMPPTTEVERVERRKSEVLKLARKGLTSSEISRRMRISQDQVEFIIRMRREKG